MRAPTRDASLRPTRTIVFALFASTLSLFACSEDSGRTFACTEQGVHDAVAAGGGVHTFSCDGPTTIRTEDEIVIDQDVVLDGRGELILDGRLRHRVLQVREGVTAELRRIVVQNGDADEDSSFTDSGGGILNLGALTLRACTVTGNSATSRGGGIFTADDLEIYDSSIEDNRAFEGAGIYSFGGFVRVDQVAFLGNVADRRGGAISLRGSLIESVFASMVVVDAEFKSNNALDGAAISVRDNARLFLFRSLLEGNFGLDTDIDPSKGGGLYVESENADVEVVETTLRGNGAGWGGGIYSTLAHVDVDASTFDQNHADLGGAIVSDGASAFLGVENSTFWRNGSDSIGSAGGAIYSEGDLFIAHSTFKRNAARVVDTLFSNGDLDLRNSYIDGGCVSNAGITTSYTYARTSSACPGVVEVGMTAVYGDLGANGGPTDTIPLLGGSTVDVIPPEDCVNAFGDRVSLDQRSEIRGIDSGEGCDAGAYEVQP